MPAPQSVYEAVLHAARDVLQLSCALDAEMLGAALLGSIYAMAEGDRAAAVQEFVGEFLSATDRRAEPFAEAIREVFATLVPAADGADRVGPGRQAPAWAGQLGRVHVTGCYAYGDVYGDQTSYLVTYAYDDTDDGGPEHALVALVDHNIGIVKDVFVASSAEILTQVRTVCEHDELTWFRDEDPGRARDEVGRHLRVTDELGELPADGSLATDRALVGARLAVLPEVTTPPLDEPDPPKVPELIHDFLASPEAAREGLTGPDTDQPSLQFCLGLLVDHAASLSSGDPLRWSPAVAGFFLLDWVHRRAVLDIDDAAMLPRVVRAWSAYATWRRGLPPAAVAETAAEVEKLVPEFARLYSTGERRSPATAAVAQLIAEGVDPSDDSAIDAWLQANRDRLGDD
ncbi:hypothetical protein ACWT_0082 [Actinoplanes sp. SE50]|uniref:hypothetical protein n=1 Tax=unclassified Actinoplanes TaxID=2626549 RepID=UPI00023ED161|nr:MULTISPECIES: hypothetical protein [unclassified Actinoplanes]AEV81096.1 hypothetical protein ACPL_197 [Actinoplanes sp. SE50/110]ATO79497.1 hypothetical protein ACWT_0082 [Actinoplanes sp. SE50]SLL96897.1 hypothetical protein ACSP50_0086 [Actinoplanes sp. SE50/110]